MSDYKGIRRLWLAVLTLAINDTFIIDKKIRRASKSRIASEWIENRNSSEVILVCELAGIEYKDFYKFYKNIKGIIE